MTQAGLHTEAGSAARLVDGEFLLTERDFRTIATMLHTETGIVLHEGKATLLYSRLGKRLRSLGMTDFRQYCDLVTGPSGGDERGRMIRALTTNVTRFFREPHHFDHLRTVALPPLLADIQRGAPLRIWSAACSTGEEAYSIALTILGLLPNATRLDVKVLATDIDTAVLARARDGRYGAEAMAAIPTDLRSQWFEREEGGFRASAALRDLITFRPLNLIGAWPMRRAFHAVFCRNVVIYFNEATQADIWHRFVPLVAPGGHLYIGHSERVTGTAQAAFSSAGITTYRRVPA